MGISEIYPVKSEAGDRGTTSDSTMKTLSVSPLHLSGGGLQRKEATPLTGTRPSTSRNDSPEKSHKRTTLAGAGAKGFNTKGLRTPAQASGA